VSRPSSAGATISMRHFSTLRVSDSRCFPFALTTVTSAFYLSSVPPGNYSRAKPYPTTSRGQMGCHSGLASIPVFAFLERTMDVCISLPWGSLVLSCAWSNAFLFFYSSFIIICSLVCSIPLHMPDRCQSCSHVRFIGIVHLIPAASKKPSIFEDMNRK
jgi:hypothetical protein